MNKRKIAFLIMLMILSLLCVNVYATISGDISLTPSKTTELSAGESFTVTLSLSELSGTTGIDSISGYINIDENVLEDLTISSIVTNSDGYVEIDDNNLLTVYDASEVSSSSSDCGVVLNTSPTSGKGDYRLVIDLAEAISSGTDLITITFEVKSDATSGTYEDAITYSSFVIYEGTSNKYAMDDKSIDITVVDETSSDDTVTLEGITLNITSTTLTLDSDDLTLTVSPTPTNADLPNIVWTVSDEDIVELVDNEDGTATISPVSEGTVTVTATTEDGSYSVSCKITVTSSDGSDTDDTNNTANTTDNNTSNNTSNNSSNNTTNTVTNNTSNSTSNSTDNTTASGTLPYTGFKLILLPILTVILAGVVFYIKYNKYKEVK